MKIVLSSVDINDQQGPGIAGMIKHIEKIGRVSYQSYDRMTEDSAERFVDMLSNNGHWNPLSFGTVYMIIPGYDADLIDKFTNPLNTQTTPFSRWHVTDEGDILLTTNYRICLQLGVGMDIIERYWREPTDKFFHRATTHWICSRGVSHELVRHGCLRFNQESQRWISYSKERFGGEIKYIVPEWIYRVRDYYLSQYPEALEMDGVELWNFFKDKDKTVSRHHNDWVRTEEDYIYETTVEDPNSFKLRPEEARGVLNNDTKTELYAIGYTSDWFYHVPEGSKEKAGFFDLRCDKAAHPDFRVLAESLRDQMASAGFDKLK